MERDISRAYRELDKDLDREIEKKNTKSSKKSTKSPNKMLLICLYATIAVLIVAGAMMYVVTNVNTYVEVEAGQKFGIDDVWTGAFNPGISVSGEIDTSVLGYQECKAKVFGVVTVDVQVLVQDTVAPKVSVKQVTANYGQECGPENFVLNYDDKTAAIYTYVRKPDFKQLGTQDVLINVCDQGGNSVNVATKLTVRQIADAISVEVGTGVPDAKEFVLTGDAQIEYVTLPVAAQLAKVGRYDVKLKVNGVVTDGAIIVADKTSPVIKTTYIEVMLNSNVSYRKEIEVSDNYDVAAAVTVTIDNSKVNLAKVGDYPLLCTATDTSGNSITREITVAVKDSNTVRHTQEEIDKYADQVLAKIINNSMSAKQKAQAIYNYTRSNISYKVNREKGDWLQGAYDGLVNKNGDCFTFCATAKALLTRAGIKNSVIQKEVTSSTSQTNHYWNIVDIGDGWYHFDTTPRMDGTQFFMWTDAALKKYSDAHMGSHNFTRSKYPALK